MNNKSMRTIFILCMPIIIIIWTLTIIIYYLILFYSNWFCSPLCASYHFSKFNISWHLAAHSGYLHNWIDFVTVCLCSFFSFSLSFCLHYSYLCSVLFAFLWAIYLSSRAELKGEEDVKRERVYRYVCVWWL